MPHATRRSFPGFRPVRLCLSGLLFGVLSASAWAAPTLREAMEHAWERASQVHVAAGRRVEVEASRTVADSWFPEPPAIGLAEKSDRFNRNAGEREREIELALPLWLPGQRDARLALAAKDAADADADLAAARLDIAGELRAAIRDLATARSELDIVGERLETAEKLAANVARREKAGDLARTDLLLTREETLSAKSALAEARNRERQAFERYRFLTGLEHLPVDIAEDIVPPGTMRHPRLRLAETTLERARAGMQVAREDRRSPPELSIGVRQARGDFAAPNTNTVRIGIRIPFATAARNAPKIAAANAELIRAEAGLRQIVAGLDAEQRAAQAGLENAEAVHQAAQARAGLAAERLALQEKAFTLGELGLTEYMWVRAAANEARLEFLRAVHALAAARAQVNQSRGIMP